MKDRYKDGITIVIIIIVSFAMLIPVFLYRPNTSPVDHIPLSTILIDSGLIDDNTSYLTFSSIAFHIDDVVFAIQGIFNLTIPVGIIQTTINISQLKLEAVEEEPTLICNIIMFYESHSKIFDGIKGAATNGWILFTLHFVYHSENILGTFEYKCSITRFDIQKVEREYVFLGEYKRDDCTTFTLVSIDIDEVSFNTTWSHLT